MNLNMTHYEWMQSYDNMTVDQIAKAEGIDRTAAVTASIAIGLSGKVENSSYRSAFESYCGVLSKMYGDEILKNESHLTVMANLITQIASVRNSEEQVFCLGNTLTWCLAKTDINIPENLVVPPYDSFYMSFEDAIFHDGRYYNGVYVKHEDTDGGRVMRIMLDDTKIANTYRIADVNYSFYRVEVDEIHKGVLYSEVVDAWENSGGGGVDFKFAREIISLVVNFMLYLSSSDVDSQTIPKTRRGKISKKKKKRAKRPNTLRITAVGGSISYDSDSEGNGSPLKRQHTVRGHWRNQPYGAGRKLRKLVYIQPFVKGPDVGESLKRKYVLEL